MRNRQTIAEVCASRGARRLRPRGLLWLPLVILAVSCLLAPPNFRREAAMDHGWNLILVNADSRVPEDYRVELVTLRNGQQVDRRIYPALQEMFDDMRSQGIYPIVASGYRTEERQRQLLEEKISEFRNMGHSRRKARKLALQWVSEPGTSEHQLGIAVDINQEDSRSTARQVYDWLEENAHHYGFVYRSPAGRPPARYPSGSGTGR